MWVLWRETEIEGEIGIGIDFEIGPEPALEPAETIEDSLVGLSSVLEIGMEPVGGDVLVVGSLVSSLVSRWPGENY